MKMRWLLQICLVVVALVGSAGESRAGGCSFANGGEPSECSNETICFLLKINPIRHSPRQSALMIRKWGPNWKAAVTEARRRGISCGGTIAPLTPLRAAFIILSKDQRKLVQSNLADLNYYKSSIDGLYGKGTAGALTEYNEAYLGNTDLKRQANVTKLINVVLAIKPTVEIAKPKVVTPVKPAPEPQPDDTYKVASGTGFYVSSQGHIITNHHVIDGCKDMKVHSKGKVLETIKIADDARNDLALLKIEETPAHVFALSQKSPFPLQDIIVAGYPFGDRVSSTLKFTQGIVSSVAGLGNDYSQIQIDAALQPGNSGGPIMDEFGNIVAVAVAKLSLKKILKDYGVVPENTNFGVKASAVKNLMEGNGVPFKAPNTEVITKQDLSRIATDGTVFLSCWMTVTQIEDMKSRKVLFTDLE